LRAAGMDSSRLKLIAIDERDTSGDFAAAVSAGLTHVPKRLPCRFFYDREGSRIFEEICELPEYYLTRAEREILVSRADEIARRFGRRTALVELGSGSAIKTRVLIEAFLRRHGALRYVPVDISRSILEESTRALIADYPGLEILAVAAEYRRGLTRIRSHEGRSKLILWLGSSIGNFTGVQAARFLAGVAAEMSPDDRLLIGADMRKDPAVLLRAYDDAAGVTARFNKNVLVRINRELGGTFALEAFRHEARWNDRFHRVEMHLASTAAQTVRVRELGLTVAFAEGETIHTENSYKYLQADIERIAARAGLTVEDRWSDHRQRFGVYLLKAATTPA
jgi:dimethylhistidine N-methyltransferase